MTLSQRGLSIHINRSTSWIRAQGEYVLGEVVREGGKYVRRHETWHRVRYQNGSLAYYERTWVSELPASEENAA